MRICKTCGLEIYNIGDHHDCVNDEYKKVFTPIKAYEPKTFDEVSAYLKTVKEKVCERCKKQEFYTIHAPFILWGVRPKNSTGYYWTIANEVDMFTNLCGVCTVEIDKQKYDREYFKKYDEK